MNTLNQNPDVVVAKFGGTSMAQPEVVADIVNSRPDQKYIVVSAPGKTEDHPIKMTDQLIGYVAASNAGDVTAMSQIRDEVVERFDSIYSSIGEKQRADLRNWTSDVFTPPHYERSPDNYIISLGERISAVYFARLVGAEVNSPTWIRFSDKGELLRDKTYGLPWFNERPIVIPGYYGCTLLGISTMLLGRGGSDRTGALAAVAASIDGSNVLYENWTDVDGIFSADPRAVPTARLIPELSRDEVREGAHGGSGVLQGDTIVDLNGSEVVTVVRNTFNTDSEGTRVLASREPDNSMPVVAVSGRGLKEVSIYDLGMANAHGYIRKVLEVAVKNGLSIEHMPAAQDAITLTLHEDLPDENIEAFIKDIKKKTISSHARVESKDKGVVYVIGEALRNPVTNANVLGRSALLLSQNDVGVDSVVSHPRSPSLALLVEKDDIGKVQQLLHSTFIG